jgi:hypothetical protein
MQLATASSSSKWRPACSFLPATPRVVREAYRPERWRRLADTRGIGWQFQEGHLRFYVTVEDPGLQGPAQPAAREKIVEAEYGDFFDHTDVAAILGPDLRAKSYAPGELLGFNLVYRHRPVKPAVSTAVLAQALASMTNRVDDFADKAGYDG